MSPIGDTALPPRTIPEPYEAVSAGHLGDTEREHLAACEEALDDLRLMFARAGKALEVIQKAKLYREDFATFEDYVEERWEMSRAHAYRLIQAWPTAEALSPIGDTSLNEGQVRELLPVSKRHGRAAAVTVYRTVAEIDGVKVTAAVLKEAVSALPAGRWDDDLAVRLIKGRLAETTQTAEEKLETDPAAALTAEVGRIRSALSRDRFRAAYRAVPLDQRRAVVAELRAMADELDKDDQAADE
jgi:hypothetical protein